MKAYERAGDLVKAREGYKQLIVVWAKADPEFQPRVAEAEAAVRRLGGIEKP